jgi:tRNA(Ile)-lysidine synthase
VPLLKEYNPRIAEALLRTAAIAEDELDLIAKLGDIAWGQNAKIKNNTVIISKEALEGAHPAIQRYLLRKAIETLTGNLRDVEAHHIENVLKALDKPAGKTIQLPYNLVFTVEYDNYLVGIDAAALSPFPPFEGEFELKVPGKNTMGNWKVETEVFDSKQNTIPLNPKRENKFIAYLDFGKVKDNLHVRTGQTGDRFQPLGMKSEKKLGMFMIDARIPHAWRNRIPLVCAGDRIIWVAGYRVDDRFKVTSRTKQVLKVAFRKSR